MSNCVFDIITGLIVGAFSGSMSALAVNGFVMGTEGWSVATLILALLVCCGWGLIAVSMLRSGLRQV